MGTNNSINLRDTGVTIYDSATAVFSATPLTKGQLLTFDGTNDVYFPLPVSTDGYVLTLDSTTDSGLKWAAVSGGTTVIETVFDNDGTWTKNANTASVLILMWNGGGGGGSGRRGTSGSSPGGGGGSCCGFLYWYGPASYFDTSETVTVGAGGNGAPAITVDNTNGSEGSLGGVSSVGNLTCPQSQGRGSGGISPSVGSAGVGTGYNQTLNLPSLSSGITANGGGGTSTGGQTGASTGSLTVYNFMPAGAGGGSGGNSSTPQQAGNGGAILNQNGSTLVSGGVGGIQSGTIAGGNGNTGLSTNGFYTGGTGGGGGGGGTTGAAGAGGNGAVPGGGGGGGGGSVNGQNSGAGGAGAKGRVVIFEFL